MIKIKRGNNSSFFVDFLIIVKTMYGIKYRLEYTGLGGFETKINILKKNYVGSIIELKGSSAPFILNLQPSEDRQFSVFKTSYCTLYILESEAIKNDFQEIEDEDDFILKYYRNNQLVWSGYILAEQYLEADSDFFVSLKFYDGISRLRVFTANDINLNETVASYPLSIILRNVNGLLYTKINSDSDLLFNPFLTSTVGGRLIDSVRIRRSSLFDNDGNALNLYDILESIATTFNFTYLMYKDRLCITNFEFTSNPKFYDYELQQEVSFTNNYSEDSNHLFIEETKELTYLDSLKKMEVTHKTDVELDFIDFDKLTVTTGSPAPVVEDDEIIFNSFNTDFPDTSNTSHRNVSIKNSQPIRVTNPTEYFLAFRNYRLNIRYRMEVEFNITDNDILLMSEAEQQTARNRRAELIANTSIRLSMLFKTSGEGRADAYVSSGVLVPDLGSGQVDLHYLLLNNDWEGLKQGVEYEANFVLPENLNEITVEFYQPVVWHANLPSSNNHRYETVKLIIEDVTFRRNDRIGLRELNYEGVTDRNVFNYNLNRDREYGYIDVEEVSYRNALLQANEIALPFNSFNLTNKEYTFNRLFNLNIPAFLLTQQLQQLGVQQRKVTGELWVKNNPSFDYLSCFNINNRKYNIHRMEYNDFEGVYDVELIEVV